MVCVRGDEERWMSRRTFYAGLVLRASEVRVVLTPASAR